MEMEYYTNEKCFLEELLSPKEMEYYTNQDFNYDNTTFNLDCNFVNHDDSSVPSNTYFFEDYCNSFPIDQSLNFSFFPSHGEGLSTPEFTEDSPNTNIHTHTVPYDFQQHYYLSNSINVDEYKQGSTFGINGVQNLDVGAPCKDEPEPVPEMTICNMGFCPENETKNKAKKISGQPSKNLMAERRRRKRLNDRLSMLRSVVPKISKMDRTSILGDTIDYMKELVERVNKLQEEMEEGTTNQFGMMTIFKDAKPNEILVRNSPKFDVERRDGDTRIKICCAGKPGLLLSTMTTLETLGLEIQQCVISCFNDFALQASCSEELKQRRILDSESIKQELFRNAGYGGRCV